MWAAADIVLNKPVGVQRAQDAQHVQVRLGVENVVDHTLRTEEEITVGTPYFTHKSPSQGSCRFQYV